MSIREFVGVIRTRWKIIVLCLLVVVGATAVMTLQATPVYDANSRIYLSTTRPSETQGGGGTFALTRDDLNTFIEVLGSPTVLEPLRAKLGLEPGTPINVSATVSDVSNVLDLRASSSDPQLAAAIANEAGPVLAAAAKKFSPLLATSNQEVEATAITPAAVPGAPTSPNPRRNLALGTLAGLLAGLGLALIRHMADTKIRSEDDVRALSDRPILASIPLVKRRQGPVLSMADDPHDMHAEAIRRLRTNILFVDVTTQGHAFVMTSSNPGEGKTTTVVNLAMSMAETGSKVLLIDGDLRSPSVAEMLGIEGGVGLTTILLNRAQAEDVIQPWGTADLHVLAAGQIPPNPSELIGSEAMSTLFQKLSQEYDFIFIDSPPINPVIDAVLLNQLAKGLIMVVASNRTKRRDLEAALASLATVDVPVAGFAVNLTSSTGPGTYHYGYGQHADPSEQVESRRGRKSGRDTPRRRR